MEKDSKTTVAVERTTFAKLDRLGQGKQCVKNGVYYSCHKLL